MAISPPSDILLDVANAADPAKVREATARLARLAADPTAPNADFGKALVAARSDAKNTTADPSTRPRITTAAAGGRSVLNPKNEVYQKFEAVLLQGFVEAMLPKDDELYGDKMSAGVYRSMMAEQFANQLARAGGIGIAKAVAASHPADQKQASAIPQGPILTRG